MSLFSEKRTIIAGLGLLAALSLGLYLVAAARVFRVGFPLDDAWIHQTYARNLAARGAWEFLPGKPSAGSTAPLWSLALSLGYWLGIDKYLWTFTLGWIMLWASGLCAAFGFRRLAPGQARYGFLAGVVVIFEWHLVWAAGSGMETLLAGLVALIVLVWGISMTKFPGEMEAAPALSWLGMGALIGGGVWVRPDMISLLGVVGLALLLVNTKYSTKIKAAVWLGIGVLLTAVPYLVFNLFLAGEIFPNTFYAKQTEYAVLRSLPLWQRYLDISRQPLTGVGIILLPGFIWFGYHKFRKKAWSEFLSFTWVFGYLLVYALRLPVTYQHGRYVMPIIPAFCLFGLLGMATLVDRRTISPRSRSTGLAWVLSGAGVLLAFWVIGWGTYAQDVAVIESEMVATARWISENTEPATLLAAHDIGALGYFGERNLIDLAGLVSPEVIPIIRDETALEKYISDQSADYLVTFPGWYRQLVEGRVKIYQTEQNFSPSQGGENMAVYRWSGG